MICIENINKILENKCYQKVWIARLKITTIITFGSGINKLCLVLTELEVDNANLNLYDMKNYSSKQLLKILLVSYSLIFLLPGCSKKSDIIVKGINNISREVCLIELDYFNTNKIIDYQSTPVDANNKFLFKIKTDSPRIFMLTIQKNKINSIIKYQVDDLYTPDFIWDHCINFYRINHHQGENMLLYLSPNDEVVLKLDSLEGQVSFAGNKNPLYGSFPYFLNKDNLADKLSDPTNTSIPKILKANEADSIASNHIKCTLDSIYSIKKDSNFYNYLRSEVVYASKSTLMQYYHLMMNDSVLGYYEGKWEFDLYDKIFDFDTINSTLSREFSQFLEFKVNHHLNLKNKKYNAFNPFGEEKYQVAKTNLNYPYSRLYLESRINWLKDEKLKADFIKNLESEKWEKK